MTTHATTHGDYDDMSKDWRLVASAVIGKSKFKEIRAQVLPSPDESDIDRTKCYFDKAVYTNIVGRTKAGLLGACDRRPPTIDLPPELEMLEEDFDGAGQSIRQFYKDLLSNVLQSGRAGLLVDYPSVEEGLSLEQAAALSLSPYVKLYEALAIINWKVKSLRGRQVLCLVVLAESEDVSDDEFIHEGEKRYRVLRLREDGYTQQLYDEEGPISEEIYPRDGNGAKFDEIPFFFVGSQNNDPSVDPIPLYDIAHLNIAHFRNSADLEENSFLHGQLTLGLVTDLDSEQFKQANPKGVALGARGGVFLGSGGNLIPIQAEPNQLADKLMERKEEQMRAIGARLIEQREEAKTATASKIDATGENSVLGDIVTNCEEGIIRSLEWCARFMGSAGEITFEANRSFFPENVDPQTVMAAIQLYDRSLIAFSDLAQLSRKADIIDRDRTDDDIKEERQSENPVL